MSRTAVAPLTQEPSAIRSPVLARWTSMRVRAKRWRNASGAPARCEAVGARYEPLGSLAEAEPVDG